MNPEDRIRAGFAARRDELARRHDPHAAYTRFTKESTVNRFLATLSARRVWMPALTMAVVVTAVVGLAVAGGDNDRAVNIAGQPTSTAGEDPSVTTSTTGTTRGSTMSSTPDDPRPEPVDCNGTRYQLTIPPGWSTPAKGQPGRCAMFSPAPISLASGSDYQLEIDIAVTDELYELALRRIQRAPEYDIVDQMTTTVSGQQALLVNATTTGAGLADAGRRLHFYVVDLGNATLYAVANEWTSQSQAGPDYDRNIAALDQMMSSIRLGAAATPACVPPLPEGSDTSLGRPVYLEMDPGDDPGHLELLVPIGTNAAGINWSLLTEQDCQWRQVAELAQHLSAASPSNWSCLQLEDGVQIQTWDMAAGEVTTWSLSVDRTALDEVGRAPYQTLPSVLGPDSC